MAVKVNVNAAGLGKVELDGVDVSNRVRRVMVVAQAGMPNFVRLELIPGNVDANFEADHQIEMWNVLDRAYLSDALAGRSDNVQVGRVFCEDWRSLKGMLDWCRDRNRVWCAGAVAGGFEVTVELRDDEEVVVGGVRKRGMEW